MDHQASFMDKERLMAIIGRIADNTATDEDIRIYNAWCNAMQDPELEVPGIPGAQLRTGERIARRIARGGRVTTMKRVAVAAAFTGAVALGFYLFRLAGAQQALPHAPATATIRNDIPSGASGATLVLANGKQIALTQAQNGRLAEQAGAAVTKTREGILEYRQLPSAGANNQYNTLRTTRGQQYQLVLADGTKVWLNASSSLRFPASFAKMPSRQVELSGEAYFEVAADAAQPFIVRTNRQQVEVLGTHFNISSYADEPDTKTTLLEGAVKINNRQVLKPGQQAVSGDDGALKVAAVYADAAIAWKNGYFEFNNENIYEIMRKIARWYDVEVVYEGDIPLNGMEGTISRFENVSRVLETIQKAGLLKFRIVQRKIYVSKY